MSAPIDYAGQGLVYLDDAQVHELRCFADATIAQGDYLSGARLRELLDAYPFADEAADKETELQNLREQGQDLATEISELHGAVEKMEADLDEQIGAIKFTLEETPVPSGAKPTKKNTAIAQQAHLLDVESAAKRAVDMLVELSSRLAALKESLKTQAKDVDDWCATPEEPKT